MSEIKSVEHSTLKVPYEVMNKKFRVVQKAIDREIDQIQYVSRDIDKTIKDSGHPTISEVDRLVGCMVQRIHILKRKAAESIEDELNSSNICKRKLDHLKGIAYSDEGALDLWQAAVDKWRRVDNIFRISAAYVNYEKILFILPSD